MTAGRGDLLKSGRAGASRRLAVVGAGWAGLSAAVRAVEQGWQVHLFDMARHAGGRARSVAVQGHDLDNGQHILIGAYHRSLALMATVSASTHDGLWRGPLALVDPAGRGLRLPPGPPLPAFALGVARVPGWRWRDKLALLATATGWMARGFQCPDQLTVAGLCSRLPSAVLRDLVEPLCVAALNTPSSTASAAVFLRVLRDALFSGAGSADLLLPCRGLSDLLPEPALAWLRARGATVRLGCRVTQVQAQDAGWTIGDASFDAVVLACSATQAAQLARHHAPAWAGQAEALQYEPIVTAYLQAAGWRAAQPMVAMPAGADEPAQFVFDLGQLGRAPGLAAAVVSGAAPWLADGLAATGQAIQRQLRRHWPGCFDAPHALVHLAAERRATFACVAGLQRPPLQVAPRLVAAGDYIAGPYPATLEGAVRAGEAAVAALR